VHFIKHLCVALARGRARRRRVLVVATVCGLGALEFDTVLLAVVTLIRAVAVIASIVVVVVVGGGVGWRGCAVVVIVVVRLRVVVPANRSGSPACAVEGCATGLSPATRSDAAV
jgi:hypothetical protein